MQVQVVVNSACALKNVNWRHGMIHPYAVVWIDTSRKCSTKVDMINSMNPVWNEKFTIPLPPTSFLENAILYINIVHANAAAGTKPLVGSARFQLSAVLNEARANGEVPLCLNLLRPSGRPQGSVKINMGVKDSNIGQINQYNPQQTPYKQHVAAQPLPQVQMQPQAHFQPRPQVQQQGQFQPRPQVIAQGQFQPQPQVIPQGQFQPQPQVIAQGQFQPQPQVIPQGQFQPQPQVIPQGQCQPQPQVIPQGQFQPQPQVIPQGKIQPLPIVQPQVQYQHQLQVLHQGQSQPRPRSQQHPKLQPQVPQVPQVQPMKKNPNKPTPVKPVVYPPNSNGPVRPAPAQGPRNSMPAAKNRPTYRQANQVPVQKQNNPAFGMGPRADVARRNRDVPIGQNQNGQFINNVNSNAAPGAAGANDNGETKSTPGADNTVDKSSAEYVEETHSTETFNDAESIHISYDETPNVPVDSDNGGHDDYGEYATEEYDNGGYNANAGAVEYDNEEYGHEGYDANAGAVEYANEEYDNGGYNENAGVVEYANEEYGHEGYDANAGAVLYANEEYDNGGYDANAGAVEYANEEYGHGDYDANAGVEFDNGGYDVNAGTECDYGVDENSHDYVNEQCDGAVDGAGLDSHVDGAV